MSKLLKKAQAIGAGFALIVCKKGSDQVDYIKFYKRGTLEVSRNCLLYYNEERRRWDNSSELSFANIEKGLKWINRKYSIIDFDKQERKSG